MHLYRPSTKSSHYSKTIEEVYTRSLDIAPLDLDNFAANYDVSQIKANINAKQKEIGLKRKVWTRCQSSCHPVTEQHNFVGKRRYDGTTGRESPVGREATDIRELRIGEGGDTQQESQHHRKLCSRFRAC